MSYPGGKGADGVYQAIINQIPPHTTFVELFLGHGSILRAKRPAAATIGVEIDPAVLRRWTGEEVPNFTLIGGCALQFLAWFTARGVDRQAFVFADPPYLHEVRASGRQHYTAEFGKPEEHLALLNLLKLLPCPVMVCGYWSALYARELKGWRTLTYNSPTRGGWSGTEWLWMNYREPLALHDYRYLGDDYRQRENIKRQRLRWRRRLLEMPAQRRYAMLAELEALRCSTGGTARIGGEDLGEPPGRPAP